MTDVDYRHMVTSALLPVARPRAIDRNWTRWFLVSAIAALLFSYPLTTPILLTLGLPTGAANLAIKSLIAVIFAVIAVMALDSPRRGSSAITCLLIFLTLLGARIVYDVVIRDILAIFQTPFYVLSYYFGLTVVPVIAMVLALKENHTKDLHNTCYWILIAANVSLVLYILLGGTITADNLYSGRFQVDAVEESTAVLNPITVAFAGTCLAAFGIGRLLTLASLNIWQQGFTGAMVLLGTSNMLSGGSRGPAVAYALMLIAALYVLARGTLGFGGLWTRKPMWLYLAVAVVAAMLLINPQTSSIQTIDRLVDTLAARREGGLETRDFTRELALADFSDSPIIGSSYLTSATYEFPHNVLLDVLMGTGLIGFVFFAVAGFAMLLGMVRLLHGRAGPYGVGLALAGLCEMVMGLTSQTAWQSPDFWMAFVYMLILGNAHLTTSLPVVVSGENPTFTPPFKA